MRFRIFLLLLLSFVSFHNVFAAEAVFEVYEAQFFGDTITVGNNFSIRGDGFGTESDDIIVHINGDEYTPESVKDFEIVVKMTSDMSSGLLYIEKAFETDGKKYDKETERIDVDFHEPQITQIEAVSGFAPGGKIKVYGKYLTGASFWCDKTELSVSDVATEYSTLDIPNDGLDCSLVAIHNLFEHDTYYRLKVAPIPTVTGLIHRDDYIILQGNGFYAYKDEKLDIVLEFANTTKLSHYSFISDKELRFDHRGNISGEGNVRISFEGTSIPLLYKDFQGLPQISSVKFRQINSKNEYEYDVRISGLIGGQDHSVFIDGRLYGKFTSSSFLITRSTPFIAKIETYVVVNNLEGRKTTQFLHYKKTEIFSLRALTDVNSFVGRLRVSGVNLKGIKYTSSQKFILDPRSDYALDLIVDDVKEGDVTVSFYNAFGKSEEFVIDLPAKEGDVFYPKMKIEDLEFPNGKYPGEPMILIGSGLGRATNIFFNDKNYSLKDENGIKSFIIPQDTQEDIEFYVFDSRRVTSNQMNIKIFDKQISQRIEVKFPVDLNKKTLHPSEEFTDVFSFTAKNTKKDGDLFLHFSWKCRSQTCLSMIPVTDFRLIGEGGIEMKNIELNFLSESKIIKIKKIPLDNNGEVFTYTLQTKTSPFMTYDMEYVIALESAYIVPFGDEHSQVLPVEIYRDEFFLAYEADDKIMGAVCVEKINDKNEESDWSNCEADREEGVFQDNNVHPVDNFDIYEIPVENQIHVPRPILTDNISFSDVPENIWFYNYINDLYKRKIIQGYGDNTFQPAGNINRAELLKMVIVSRGESWGEYVTVHFEDTAESWAKDVIEYALIKGYINKSKKFQPAKAVTRGETAKLLCVMFPKIQQTAKHIDTVFPDLEKHFAKKCIQDLRSQEVVSGYEDGNFYPHRLVTRAEFAKMLSRVLELEQK